MYPRIFVYGNNITNLDIIIIIVFEIVQYYYVQVSIGFYLIFHQNMAFSLKIIASNFEQLCYV